MAYSSDKPRGCCLSGGLRRTGAGDGSAQRINHRAAERALFQNHNSANGGTERRAHLVLQLARMLARFQHQLRRTQNRLRGNLLGLRALQPFGHAGVAAFAYYQRK